MRSSELTRFVTSILSARQPFGWETLDLRYGGLASRLASMHLRVTRFLDHLERGGQVGEPLVGATGSSSDSIGGDGVDVMLNATCAEDDAYEEQVNSIPELAIPLELVYGSAEQLLDYHRVSRVTYC